jgi:hypothetical protein
MLLEFLEHTNTTICLNDGRNLLRRNEKKSDNIIMGSRVPLVSRRNVLLLLTLFQIPPKYQT